MLYKIYIIIYRFIQPRTCWFIQPRSTISNATLLNKILNTDTNNILFDFSIGYTRIYKISDIAYQISYIIYKISYLVYKMSEIGYTI